MAKPIMKYQDDLGNIFNTPQEADHSNWEHGITNEIRAYVRKRFPLGVGSKMKNPHNATALRAISGFMKQQQEGKPFALPDASVGAELDISILEDALAYVRTNFPLGVGSKLKNPHHGTALKAITGFLREHYKIKSVDLIA